MRSTGCALSLLIIVIAAMQPSFGVEASSDPSEASVLTTSVLTAAPRKGVEKVNFSLDKLSSIGCDLKRIGVATDSIFNEIGIDPASLKDDPLQAYCDSDRELKNEEAQSRIKKGHIDEAMKTLRDFVPIMKKNIDEVLAGNRELDLTPSVREELDSRLHEWVVRVSDMGLQEGELEQLTQGPTYDTNSIAVYTAAVQTDARELERIRLSISKVLKREAKRMGEQVKTADSK